jgi:hypothetical protein
MKITHMMPLIRQFDVCCWCVCLECYNTWIIFLLCLSLVTICVSEALEELCICCDTVIIGSLTWSGRKYAALI